MKILLAEDTKDMNRALTAVLEHEGYEVASAFDGAEALEYIDRDSYDVMILDIMMPKVDGLEVIREARNRKIVTPVLLLTAKAEIDDKVAGLDAGADDYLTKPFSIKELLARIRAMVRRSMDYTEQDLQFRDIRLKADGMELIAGNSVRLSQKEFELMRQLILNADHPVDTEFLLSHIWPREPEAESDTVWLYICYLKRKLEAVKSAVRIRGEKGGSFLLNE